MHSHAALVNKVVSDTLKPFDMETAIATTADGGSTAADGDVRWPAAGGERNDKTVSICYR